MAGFLSGLLAPLASAAGAGYLGYNEDKQTAVKNALAQAAAERQAKQDALAASLGGAQIRHFDAQTNALNSPQAKPITIVPKGASAVGPDGQPVFTAPDTPENETWQQHPVSLSGKPAVIKFSNRGTMQTLDGKDVDPSQVAPFVAPEKPEKPVLMQGTDSDGNPIAYRVNPSGGAAEPIPGFQGKNGMGGKSTAAIKKAVASNLEQMTVLDNAIAMIEKTPTATGFMRGGMGVLPKFGDAIDQRMDPSGVDARAALSNIASLKMHDRSGAAVTAAEFPRLAPFIPSVQDTPAVALKKLRQLKQGLSVETEALQANGIPQNPPSSGTRGAAPSRSPMSAADQWEALVSGGMDKNLATALVQKQYGGRQ